MTSRKDFNKDLILREQLALQRTIMANQTTLLAFLRTAMYFSVAGLSIRNFLHHQHSTILEFSFYTTSLGILAFGLINYFRQKKKIVESEQHIGDYKMEYLDKK
ncbi:MAG: DUF202 domain-containing protein [Thermonemataceae bacterium]|nr:DUF202 domain-containing protein [Thermonemataceae bacterium]